MRKVPTRLFLMRTRLEPTSTNVAAAPMPRPLKAWVVRASVGQVPRTRRRTGFSLIQPAKKMSFMLFRMR